jgi:hypothetical protein
LVALPWWLLLLQVLALELERVSARSLELELELERVPVQELELVHRKVLLL